MDDAVVYDYNVYALEAKARRASAAGNLIEVHAIGLLIDGYLEGLWSVSWDRGEPFFAARVHDHNMMVTDIAKKD